MLGEAVSKTKGKKKPLQPRCARKSAETKTGARTFVSDLADFDIGDDKPAPRKQTARKSTEMKTGARTFL